MSPRTDQQFIKIRDARKTQIMQVALELFANRGFAGTSVADIASKAGISKGLLYNYFENKVSLIREIIFEGYTALLSSLDPNHDGVITRDEMHFLTIGIFNTIRKDIQYWRLYFGMLTQPAIYRLVGERFESMSESVYRMLAAYFRSEGSSSPDADARLFMAVLDGISMNYVYDPERFPLQEVTNRMLELYNLANENPEN